MITMYNSETTRFKDVIRITPEQSKYIQSTKGKKSKAGKLEEIIKFYIDNYENRKIQGVS